MIAVLPGWVALVIVAIPLNVFAQAIDNLVVRSVVQLVTPASADGRYLIGTGFLISVAVPEVSGPIPPTFLVTNKHMIGTYNPTDKDNNVDPIEDWIGLRLYTGSVPPIEEIRVGLKGSDGKLNTSRCALDPDPLVDVAVIRVDDTLVTKYQNKRIKLSTLGTDYLEPFGNLPGPYANIGAPVFALGYPRGVTSLLTNYPVAKVGHLATPGGEELAINTHVQTKDKKIVPVIFRGKLLLIDGLIVPGNSGGPVVLPGAGAMGVDPKTGLLQMKAAGSSLIIGIVSSKTSDDGLVIAFSTDYIRLLIDSLVTRIRDSSKQSK
jgi:hypothetical protein